MALIVYAPNVHTGGGRVLLQALANEAGGQVAQAILDARLLQAADILYSSITPRWVRNTLPSRLYAEWQLWRLAQPGDTVLCMHSLPPLLPLRARTVVLVQNRLLLERGDFGSYPLKTRLRIAVERLWARSLQGRVQRYVVQTPSMAQALTEWLHRPVPVSVVPFAPRISAAAPNAPPDCNHLSYRAGSKYTNQPGNAHRTSHGAYHAASTRPEFDFIYPASGEAHKNHQRLLQAWQLLAEAGLKPSLALTVDAQQYPALAAHIAQQAAAHGLSIRNFGTLTQAQVLALYAQAGALLFPSLVESFGLPLIEAAQHGLPIVASERDFVRDVALPVQTFDPHSALSIARAVRLHLGEAAAPLRIVGGAHLLDEALR